MSYQNVAAKHRSCAMPTLRNTGLKFCTKSSNSLVQHVALVLPAFLVHHFAVDTLVDDALHTSVYSSDSRSALACCLHVSSPWATHVHWFQVYHLVWFARLVNAFESLAHGWWARSFRDYLKKVSYCAVSPSSISGYAPSERNRLHPLCLPRLRGRPSRDHAEPVALLSTRHYVTATH